MLSIKGLLQHVYIIISLSLMYIYINLLAALDCHMLPAHLFTY